MEKMLYCGQTIKKKRIDRQMEWFCTDEERSALKTRVRRLSTAFRILAAVTAAVFIILCLMIRTENAQTMHWVLMVSTILLGWACIILWTLGVKESRTQLAHLEMILEGEKDFLEGTVTLTRDSVQIPKSIQIRKVLLNTGEETPRRLNLDEKWIHRMPPDGSRVRLALTHSYIAGAELLEKPDGNSSASGVSRKPAQIRKAARLFSLLGVWIIAAVIFSSFVFYQITDTDAAHKITIYIDGEIRDEARLAARLEKELPDQIRMVQIHPFRYAMFGSAALQGADLFIVPDSDKNQFADWFASESESFPVYDPETGISVAGTWILYSPGDTYRLYLGAESPHLKDGLARRAAELLVSITGPEKEETP